MISEVLIPLKKVLAVYFQDVEPQNGQGKVGGGWS